MLTKKKLIIFLLLSLVVSVTCEGSATEIKPGVELKNEKIVNLTEYKYYKFKVGANYKNGMDITIRTSLTEEYPWANPDIFLSKITKNPTASNHSIACKSFGEDICTINKNEISVNDEWYVGITWDTTNSRGSQCVYNIMLEYVEELILLDGKPITVYIYEGQEFIFKYFVPNDPDIRHIQISSQGKDAFSKFEMLTVKGNDPPGTDRRRHSWPAWNNGWVSRFEPGCDCFCVNCNYTTMLQVDTEGYYTITAKSSKAIESVQSGQLYDNVFKDRVNCYSYYVSNPQNDFTVKMKVYGGDPDLFINPKTADAQLSTFKYNSLEKLESEELIITSKMREDDQLVVGEYFIWVYGKFTSSFKLTVHNDDISPHMLESGTSESGYLEKNEFTNYWYSEDILKSETNITFQLHAMSGSSVLRYKLWPVGGDIEQSKKDCSHNLEELTKPIPDENRYYGIGQETIEHNPSTCNKSNPIINYIREQPPTCMYNIGILGASDSIKSHYGVTIRHQEGHHVLLSEGKVVEGSLIQKQYNYYKISISDPTITSITVQLLTIHGDPDLFMAKKEEYPTDTKFEKRATICGRYPDTIRYDVKVANDSDGNNSLTGNYYIGVYGFIESSYHLYYHTERDHIDDEGNSQTVKLPMLLMQNKHISGMIKTKDDYNLYSFSVANATTDDEIIIRLTPQNGKFIVNAKFNGTATLTDFDIQAGAFNHYTISYNPAKNPEYRHGTFTIFVKADAGTDLESSGMSYTYLITYFIGSHHLLLLNDQQTLGHTKEDVINYYSYSYSSNTASLTLTITKLSNDIDTFISLNPSVTFPTAEDVSDDEGVYHYKKEKIEIQLKQWQDTDGTIINKYCLAPPGSYCKLIVAVKGMNPAVESSYVLTMVKNEDRTTPKKIENSIPYHGSLKEGQWDYYYFKTSKEQDVYSVVVPNKGDPNVYVKIVTNFEQKQDSWKYPVSNDYYKKSVDSVGADILVLTKEDLKIWGSSCVLLFGIEANQQDSEYTFTTTRGLIMLKEKESFTDSLGASGNYKFYEYYRACTDCTTAITVNSLSNDQYDIFVNFNTTEKITSHQDRSSADFIKQGRDTQDLVITVEDLIAKGYTDETGYFLIEIHSHSNINYTISVSSNKELIHSISSGMWTPVYINGEVQNKYFVYKHHSPKGFYITRQFEYGYGDVFVNALHENEKGDMSKHLPENGQEAHWASWSSPDWQTLKIEPIEGNKFCETCYYLINVHGYSPAKGSIAIQEIGAQSNSNKMTILKIGKPTKIDFDSEQYIHLKFIVPNNEPLIIDVNVLSGNTEYILSNNTIEDSQYYTDGNISDEDRGIIYRGYSYDSYYEFDSSNRFFKVGSVYYLTLYSYEMLSRAIITVSHKGKYNHISDTMPQRIKMDNSVHAYYYTVNPHPGKIRLIIEAFPTNTLETFKLYTKIVDIKDAFKDDDASTAPEWQINPDSIINGSDQKLVYQGKSDEKLYLTFDVTTEEFNKDKVVLIAVQPTQKNPSGSLMDLYVASSNVQTLELDMIHSGNVENKKDVFKIYEAFVPPKSNETYVVELDPCWGKLEMYVAKDISKMLKGEYESKASHLTNGRLFALLENNSKNTLKYNIAIKSLNNLTDEYNNTSWSDFSIQARKYPNSLAHNTFLEKYYVPNEGAIEWTAIRRGEFQITWSRVMNAEGTEEIPNDKVFYDIYASTQDYVTMDSTWSMSSYFYPYNNYKNIFELKENTYTIKLKDVHKMEGTDDGEKLHVNVLARITEDSDEENPNNTYSVLNYPVAYRPLALDTHIGDGVGGINLIFLLIVIGLITLLLLCIIYFYRKYKRTKKKLDFEVREVRGGDFGQEMEDSSYKVYNRSPDEETNKPNIE